MRRPVRKPSANNAAAAVILGSPTYEGSCTWQMKRYIDSAAKGLAGKLGGVFASQNWPGGGGASFAEMTMIAGLLVLAGCAQGPGHTRAAGTLAGTGAG